MTEPQQQGAFTMLFAESIERVGVVVTLLISPLLVLQCHQERDEA